MSLSHAVQFYTRCLNEAIAARDEACQAGDYPSFCITELDIQNYQTMLDNAKQANQATQQVNKI